MKLSQTDVRSVKQTTQQNVHSVILDSLVVLQIQNLVNSNVTMASTLKSHLKHLTLMKTSLVKQVDASLAIVHARPVHCTIQRIIALVAQMDTTLSSLQGVKSLGNANLEQALLIH